jgi:hypothetical protein
MYPWMATDTRIRILSILRPDTDSLFSAFATSGLEALAELELVVVERDRAHATAGWAKQMAAMPYLPIAAGYHAQPARSSSRGKFFAVPIFQTEGPLQPGRWQ